MVCRWIFFCAKPSHGVRCVCSQTKGQDSPLATLLNLILHMVEFIVHNKLNQNVRDLQFRQLFTGSGVKSSVSGTPSHAGGQEVMNSPQAPSKYKFNKKYIKLRLYREETLNAIHFEYEIRKNSCLGNNKQFGE